LKSIELIEAGPSATSRQAFKELGHGFEVDAALTVEHVAVSGTSLGHVFNRLSFASTYRPDR